MYNESMNNKDTTFYADDDYESISTLLGLRTPALVIGLALGIGISLVTSRFEEVLAKNIQVAFFLPFIVYIASAVGTQTEAIYSGDLKTGSAKFSNYFYKESMLGLIYGFVFGALSGGVALLWLKSDLLALSVAISTFFAIAVAPVVALLVTHVFKSMHKDPAAGSGPITTVIQDVISILIYGMVSSIIMLG